MSRKKLTLSVEERLTRRAKAIAEERGTSVSRLVETFFTALEQEEDAPEEGTSQESSLGSPPTDSDPSPSAAYEPSEWAQRWRGAFAEEGATYPDDPSWEEEVLADEIEKKHTD